MIVPELHMFSADVSPGVKAMQVTEASHSS